MKLKRFKVRYIITITGESSSYLEHSIHEFITETIIPLFQNLKNSNEKLHIKVRKEILPLDKKKTE